MEKMKLSAEVVRTICEKHEKRLNAMTSVAEFCTCQRLSWCAVGAWPSLLSGVHGAGCVLFRALHAVQLASELPTGKRKQRHASLPANYRQTGGETRRMNGCSVNRVGHLFEKRVLYTYAFDWLCNE